VRSIWENLLAGGLAASLALPLAVGPQTASAQEKRSPSILEFFGLKPAKPRVVIVPKKPAKKRIVKITKSPGRKKPKWVGGSPGSPSTSPAATRSQPLSDTVLAKPEKAEDAKTVLVVGDFMAGGLAEGLDTAFETEAGVRIVDKSGGSSGFVRSDVFDWPQSIAGLVSEAKPSVVVVMIGTNDRQQMVVGGAREQIQSPAWTAEYDKRVSSFTTALKLSGVPVVWVGLPPFKQQTMSAGILAFNDLYQKKAESISGQFVDIWDGFLDDQGAFTINGFDYTGQPAKLRASDGINLTTAGRRKVAFFAEKPIRIALGTLPQPASLSTALGPFSLPGPVRPSSALPENITSLPPISLFDPAFDGAGELLGAAASVPANAGTLPAAALYQRGEMPAPQPGRIDELRIRGKISPMPNAETGSVAPAP
jgi:uncharacterized protein